MHSQLTPRARRIQRNDPCPCGSGLKSKKCHGGAKTDRPHPLIVNVATVDPSLIAIPHWVLWRYEKRGDKYTKVPYQVSGAKASSKDPKTWNSYLTVLAAYQADGGRRYDGIGLVMVETLGLVGIDLDHCIGKTGVIDTWALDIVTAIASRAEKSPSGTGLRIFAKGTGRPEQKRQHRTVCWRAHC